MFFQNIHRSIPEDIEYICKLIFEAFKLPVYFLDAANEVFYSFTYGYANNPLAEDKNKLFIELFQGTEANTYPTIKSTKYYENYFAVNLNIDDMYLGKFIVGPSTYSYISPYAVDTLITDNQIPISYKRDLVNYFNSLTVMDYRRLLSASQLLNLIVYREKLDLAAVIERNSSLKNIGMKINSSYENSLSENRENTFFHHSLAAERSILKCIKEGDVESLIKLQQAPKDGEYGILSKNNPLRSEKNLSICLVTLATRAAIEGGLDAELAFTLSDSSIQAIEEINDVTDLWNLNNIILCDFASRVRKVKSLNYSKNILLCISYVQKHLYENISVSDLAEILDVNPNYLSELFKKEVGITLSEYIQREKIEEAKRLLTSTLDPILYISARLNFHDQSHFTKLFKKFTGLTPKKYRNKNQ
ncbi:helix-turn-helix domain-containing protein [Clostridium thermarum]|uniref:helix-turn-helix domain-containing protein n=1 Tax=Clostridium thermarum TaxID=1716543 RepID=UPI0011206E33|nr:helix-turn-helix domain-containing protein [Clostridium thermarum]